MPGAHVSWNACTFFRVLRPVCACFFNTLLIGNIIEPHNRRVPEVVFEGCRIRGL